MSGLRRDRKFELVLYPDSDSYDCDAVITLAQSYFSDWAYCLHYADTTDDGELKKAHIHFVGKLSDVKSPEVVCKDLGLPLNAISNIKIMEYIVQSGCTKVSDVTLWALNNGCYSGFRRGFAIWCQILREN